MNYSFSPSKDKYPWEFSSEEEMREFLKDFTERAQGASRKALEMAEAPEQVGDRSMKDTVSVSTPQQEDETAAAVPELNQAVWDVLDIAEAVKDKFNDRNDFDIVFKAAIQARFGPDFLAHHLSRRQLY